MKTRFKKIQYLVGAMLTCASFSALSATAEPECKVPHFTATSDNDGKIVKIDTSAGKDDCTLRAKKLAYYGKWRAEIKAEESALFANKWIQNGEAEAREMADYMAKTNALSASVDLVAGAAKGVEKLIYADKQTTQLIAIQATKIVAKATNYVKLVLGVLGKEAEADIAGLTADTLNLLATTASCLDKRDEKRDAVGCVKIVKEELKTLKSFGKVFGIQQFDKNAETKITGWVEFVVDAAQSIQSVGQLTAASSVSSGYTAAASLINVTAKASTGEYWKDKSADPLFWDEFIMAVASSTSNWYICKGAVVSLVDEQKKFIGNTADCVSSTMKTAVDNMSRLMARSTVLYNASQDVYNAKKLEIARMLFDERLKYQSFDDLYRFYKVSLTASDRNAQLVEAYSVAIGYDYRLALGRVLQVWSWQRYGDEVANVMNRYAQSMITDAKGLESGSINPHQYAKNSYVRFATDLSVVKPAPSPANQSVTAPTPSAPPAASPVIQSVPVSATAPTPVSTPITTPVPMVKMFDFHPRSLTAEENASFFVQTAARVKNISLVFDTLRGGANLELSNPAGDGVQWELRGKKISFAGTAANQYQRPIWVKVTGLDGQESVSDEFKQLVVRPKPTGVTPAPAPVTPAQPSIVSPSLVDGMKFHSETILDGTTVGAGSLFTKTWTLRNSGTTTWNNTYCLKPKTGVSGDTALALATSSVCVTGTVSPNATYMFSTPMTAPAARDVATTYTQNWVLMHGQTNLGGVWAKINVNALPRTVQPAPAAVPTPASAPVPTQPVVLNIQSTSTSAPSVPVNQSLTFNVIVDNPAAVDKVNLVFPAANVTEAMTQEAGNATWSRSRIMSKAGNNLTYEVWVYKKGDANTIKRTGTYTVTAAPQPISPAQPAAAVAPTSAPVPVPTQPITLNIQSTSTSAPSVPVNQSLTFSVIVDNPAVVDKVNLVFPAANVTEAMTQVAGGATWNRNRIMSKAGNNLTYEVWVYKKGDANPIKRTGTYTVTAAPQPTSPAQPAAPAAPAPAPVPVPTQPVVLNIQSTSTSAPSVPVNQSLTFSVIVDNPAAVDKVNLVFPAANVTEAMTQVAGGATWNRNRIMSKAGNNLTYEVWVYKKGDANPIKRTGTYTVSAITTNTPANGSGVATNGSGGAAPITAPIGTASSAATAPATGLVTNGSGNVGPAPIAPPPSAATPKVALVTDVTPLADTVSGKTVRFRIAGQNLPAGMNLEIPGQQCGVAQTGALVGSWEASCQLSTTGQQTVSVKSGGKALATSKPILVSVIPDIPALGVPTIQAPQTVVADQPWTVTVGTNTPVQKAELLMTNSTTGVKGQWAMTPVGSSGTQFSYTGKLTAGLWNYTATVTQQYGATKTNSGSVNVTQPAPTNINLSVNAPASVQQNEQFTVSVTADVEVQKITLQFSGNGGAGRADFAAPVVMSRNGRVATYTAAGLQTGPVNYVIKAYDMNGREAALSKGGSIVVNTVQAQLTAKPSNNTPAVGDKVDIVISSNVPLQKMTYTMGGVAQACEGAQTQSFYCRPVMNAANSQTISLQGYNASGQVVVQSSVTLNVALTTNKLVSSTMPTTVNKGQVVPIKFTAYSQLSSPVLELSPGGRVDLNTAAETTYTFNTAGTVTWRLLAKTSNGIEYALPGGSGSVTVQNVAAAANQVASFSLNGATLAQDATAQVTQNSLPTLTIKTVQAVASNVCVTYVTPPTTAQTGGLNVRKEWGLRSDPARINWNAQIFTPVKACLKW